jgi:hypothetical protein
LDLPENQQEVESVLETDLPYAPKTQAGSPKDKLGSNEHKSETLQQEINISVVNNQLSIDPTLDASISIDTQILNE